MATATTTPPADYSEPLVGLQNAIDPLSHALAVRDWGAAFRLLRHAQYQLQQIEWWVITTAANQGKGVT